MADITLAQALEQGMKLQQAGQLDEAERLYRAVLDAEANNADALHLLGIIEQQRGRHDRAIPLFHQAIAARPDAAEFRHNLGNSLIQTARREEAIEAFAAAVRLDPNLFEAQHNLGAAFTLTSRSNRAVEAFAAAASIKPDSPDAHNNYGLALKDQGDIRAAIEEFNKAEQVSADYQPAHNNHLYALHYDPTRDAKQIFDAHRDWAKRFADPLSPKSSPPRRVLRPGDRLRIGYVSPDLRGHPIGRSMLPLIEHADRDRFKIVCFSDMASNDAVAVRLRAAASQWHETAHLNHDQFAGFVAEQRIDLLVDLALQMRGNRLLAFARRPAPVQATFIGYPATTGLSQIDYRITDAWLDPPGETEAFNSEKLIRLPRSFWCYVPDESSSQVGELPATRGKTITFGSLNNPCKMNDDVIDTWSKILRAVPKSRLLLFVIERENIGERFRDLFARRDIDPARLTFVSRQDRPSYLKQYAEIDIALDPFPYNGHMTSCDAFWMGVPVVSLSGQTSVGRGGESLLASLDLLELLADSRDRYVQIAVSLANDLPASRQSARIAASAACLIPRSAMPKVSRATWKSHSIKCGKIIARARRDHVSGMKNGERAMMMQIAVSAIALLMK